VNNPQTTGALRRLVEKVMGQKIISLACVNAWKMPWVKSCWRVFSLFPLDTYTHGALCALDICTEMFCIQMRSNIVASGELLLLSQTNLNF